MSALPQRMSIRRKAQRLRWLSRRARDSGLRRRTRTVTLGQLEDSRRPLLFSLLPRMLRSDGSTPKSLQRAFGYLERGRDRAPALVVSSQRWRRALARSRRLAARRIARDREDP